MAGSHSKRNSARVSNHASEIASANPPTDPSPGQFSDVSPSYCLTTAISPFKARNARTPVALSASPLERGVSPSLRGVPRDASAIRAATRAVLASAGSRVEPCRTWHWHRCVCVLAMLGRHIRSCRNCEIRATLSDRVMSASYAVVFSPLTLKFRSKAYERCIRT